MTYTEFMKWYYCQLKIPAGPIEWTVSGSTYVIPEEVWGNLIMQGAEIEKGDYKKGQMPEPVITLDQCSLIK